MNIRNSCLFFFALSLCLLLSALLRRTSIPRDDNIQMLFDFFFFLESDFYCGAFWFYGRDATVIRYKTWNSIETRITTGLVCRLFCYSHCC